MALPAKSSEEVVEMSAAERREYFEEYARYLEDAPRLKYGIRIGSTMLFAEDTLELWRKFNNKVAALKRKLERRRHDVRLLHGSKDSA